MITTERGWGDCQKKVFETGKTLKLAISFLVYLPRFSLPLIVVKAILQHCKLQKIDDNANNFCTQKCKLVVSEECNCCL